MKNSDNLADFHPNAHPDMDDETSIDIDRLLSIARRQWRVVALAIVVAVAIGSAYLFTAVPLYTSTASLLIDAGNKKIVDELSAVGGIMQDEASILSQVELLKSEKIAIAVAQKLDLANDPSFNADHSSPINSVFNVLRSFSNIKTWFASDAVVATDDAKLANAVKRLSGSLDVSRLGRTYVLQLSYTSANPALSARIAEAYAEAYLDDQLDSKYEATRRASDWLQARIGELRQKSLATDQAVQKFKADKGLIATGGELISDQQLSQLNAQLIIAQAETADSEAKYNRIKSIIDSGQMDAIVTDALASGVISGMREKYLDASKREADISNRLGENHVQAIRLRQDMEEYKRLMFEELSRIAESYHSSYQVSKARLQSLQDSVNKATNVSSSANDAQVQLRELEREAESYKNLYQTFLQRYQEAVQQQSFPVTEARIISKPTVPNAPSAPKKSLVLALSMMLGAMAGAGIGAFREFRDRFFRTGDQIKSELDLEFLGTVPLAASTMLGAPETENGVAVHPRSIIKTTTVANYVIDNPLSSFAETIRSAKIAIDVATGNAKPKIVGVTSLLPGEGKSTISINIAELLSNQGARTLLIDADLRNPGATRQLGRTANAGLMEALQDGTPIMDLILVNPETKLAFLPAIVKRRIPYSSELLSSEAMDRVLAQAEGVFDYVIVDLPPLAPVVDARAIASKMDAFLFVVEWGRTARSAIRKGLEGNRAVAAKCAGVILNKVDADKMKMYQSYGSSEYYHSRYSSYYRDGK